MGRVGIVVIGLVVCLFFPGWLAMGQDVLSSRSLSESSSRSVILLDPSLTYGDYSQTADIQTAEIDETSTALAPTVGYANGYVIASPDLESIPTREYPFSVRLSSWLQMRHAIFQSDGPNRDRNAFSLERIRIGIDGHAYSPDLQYNLVLDANSDQAVQVTFLDAFVSYDFGRNLLSLDANRLGFRAGKWKSPFSRSREESARRFQFTERSVANLFFDIGRATGVSLYGSHDLLSVPSRFEIALINGLNTGRDAVVSANDLDQNFGWSARTSLDPLGQFTDGESDLSWSEQHALRLGAGVAGSRVDRAGIREFDRPRVVASGQPLSNLLPDSVDAYDVLFFTVDGHWKIRGFSLIAEHHWRSLSQFSGGSVSDLGDSGLLVQSGYFVIPRRLEFLARWSRVVGNSGTLGLANQKTDEIGTGAVWFIKGNDVKYTMDVSWIDGVPTNSPRLSLLPGDEGWLMRSQLQVGF